MCCCFCASALYCTFSPLGAHSGEINGAHLGPIWGPHVCASSCLPFDVPLDGAFYYYYYLVKGYPSLVSALHRRRPFLFLQKYMTLRKKRAGGVRRSCLGHICFLWSGNISEWHIIPGHIVHRRNLSCVCVAQRQTIHALHALSLSVFDVSLIFSTWQRKNTQHTRGYNVWNIFYTVCIILLTLICHISNEYNKTSSKQT